MQKPDNIDALTRRIEAEGADLRKLREGMARAVGRCESLFSSQFKRLTGFPPAAFIAHCRIQKARELLERGDMTIAAIARTLGYSSSAHFSAQFRLFCGMSPRTYRTAISRSPTSESSHGQITRVRSRSETHAAGTQGADLW